VQEEKNKTKQKTALLKVINDLPTAKVKLSSLRVMQTISV
jgi:hypothetical protein